MKRIMKVFLVILAMFVAFTTPTNVEAASLKLNKKKVTIYVGKSTTLKVKGKKKKVKWKSTNKKVAKVNKKGKVTGLKAGKSTIIAKVGKKSLKCKVTVKKVVKKVSNVKRTTVTKKKVEKVTASKIQVSTVAFTKNGDLVARVKNNNSTYAHISDIKAVFKNGSGNPVHTDEFYELSLAPGETKLIAYNTKYVEGIKDTSVSFKVTLDEYTNNMYVNSGYTTSFNINKDNVGVTFRNRSGKTIKEVRFVAVYYRNNQVVGDDIEYCFENVNNNSTAYFTMDNDFDKSTFENIDYDKVEVYTTCVQSY